MFSVTLLCVGKLKEKFYLAAAEEYSKRLKGYVDFSLVELPESRLPENPSEAEIAQGLAREAEQIRARIPKGCWFCVLTPEGKQQSSEELAATLASVKVSGKSSIDRTSGNAVQHPREPRMARIRCHPASRCRDRAGVVQCTKALQDLPAL